MLKPTISTMEDEIVDHFPHLLLIHNRAQMEDFTPKKLKIMQKVVVICFCHNCDCLRAFFQIYKAAFGKSKFHLETGMGIGSGRIINVLSPENCGDPLNVFLIPEYDEEGLVFLSC